MTPLEWIAVAGIAVSVISSIYNGYQQSKANEINQENHEKQFEYQQKLNNNQYQMMAADMQKAGINPALASSTGGSLSYSSQNSNTQVGATLDTSSMSNIASTIISHKMNEDMQTKLQEKQLQAEKDIADDRNATDEYIAELQAGTNAEIARMDIQSRETLAENANKLTEKLEGMRIANEKSKIDNENSYRNKMKQLEEVESLYKNALLESQKKQVEEQIKDAKEQIKLEKSKHNWNKVDMIWRNIVDSCYKMAIGASALIQSAGGISPAGNPMGFIPVNVK